MVQFIKKILLAAATVLIMILTLAGIVFLHLYKAGRGIRAFARKARGKKNAPPQGPINLSGHTCSGEEEFASPEPVSANGKR